jgi:hypothetical protein
LPRLHTGNQPWGIWIGLAVAAGVGLRFVRLPDFALPIMVGLAVTAGVVLVLHLVTRTESPDETAHPPAPLPAGRSGTYRTPSRSA